MRRPILFGFTSGLDVSLLASCASFAGSDLVGSDLVISYCWRQKAKDGQFELVALACSGNAKHNPRLRAVIFHRPGHLRPPDPAEPRRSGRGAGRPSRGPAPLEDGPRRVARRPRGHVARESIALNRGASREAAPTRRAQPKSDASRRTPQFPLRTGNGTASPAALP